METQNNCLLCGASTLETFCDTDCRYTARNLCKKYRTGQLEKMFFRLKQAIAYHTTTGQPVTGTYFTCRFCNALFSRKTDREHFCSEHCTRMTRILTTYHESDTLKDYFAPMQKFFESFRTNKKGRPKSK